MRVIFALVFSILSISLLTGMIYAQEGEQVPTPPPIPQPEPEPEPIGPKEPNPIEEPFPGLTDEEKIVELTKENEELKKENKALENEIEGLEIEIDFLENQIRVITEQFQDLQKIALEQARVIMQLADQLKEIVFEKIFSPETSV